MRQRWRSGWYAALVLLVTACGLRRGAATASADPPVRVHLFVTGTGYDVGCTWSTNATTKTSTIRWGETAFQLSHTAGGTQEEWTDGGPLRTNRTVHNAVMAGLKPDTQYYYTVGDEAAGWSDVFSFTTLTDGTNIMTMAVFGDMGETNSRSLGLVTDEAIARELQIILHVGDFAYDLHTDNGYNGDEFMQGIQPVASIVPYVTAVGNHEEAYNFSHYRHRFSGYNLAAAASGALPDLNWWYSWDYMSGGARVHMVSISSEVYYFWLEEDLLPAVAMQFEWLKKDLAAARGSADWVIAYTHRPLYCSNSDDLPDCTTSALSIRDGIAFRNGTRGYGLDAVLNEGGVDIVFTAHQHSYERTLPLYNGFYQKQDNHTYINPNSTVNIVSGAAGCPEDLDYFNKTIIDNPWSVVHSASYGFGHLIIHNSSHLYWEQLLNEGQGGKDTLWIVKQ